LDFVLVWERNLNEKERSVAPAGNENLNLHERWRQKFLRKLEKAGIQIERHITEKDKKEIRFILLNAPWNVLCYYAEELGLPLPLLAIPNQSQNWSNELLKKLRIPNIMYENVPNQPLDYYTCQFKVTKLERFLGNDDQSTFFTNTQRHQILREILARTVYGRRKKAEVGIDRLVTENVFTAAFPLHDGPFTVPNEDIPPENLSLRQILYKYWARWGKWYKYQPLDHIRAYFGEKIALYFAWLGFYTGWLLPAAFVGTMVFAIGIYLMINDVPAKEICESGTKYMMCPKCSICDYWPLSHICTTFKAGLLFDNGGTVFFSIFMSLWAVTFLEYWKRTNAILAHRWDCFEFEEIEVRSRDHFYKEFERLISSKINGLVKCFTGKPPHLSLFGKRGLLLGYSLLPSIFVVLIFLVSIILYRIVIGFFMFKVGSPLIKESAFLIASLTGSVVNLILILILSRLYIMLAHVLTRWEMHRTQTMYDNAFISKVFIFQFVNFYSSPIYVAFFKGRFVGYPGHYYTLLGVRNEDCGAGGCLIQLAQEMLVIMVGKQIINNAQELLVPKTKPVYTIYSRKKTWCGVFPSHNPTSGQDWLFLMYCNLFSTYWSLSVLQFGFITIFVAACPLAPLFALLNNWIELRLDARKFLCVYRRAVVERAQGIGIWFEILDVITKFAVISNAFLIAFTSDFLPRVYYRYTHHKELHGYINFSLAYSPPDFIAQNHTMCRYKAYRDNDGSYSLTYWNLLAVRLSFIVVFEVGQFY
uniref:Anoctamin n=1 Tax=Latimeria chalumnae TaxID=7897 RepID=H3ADU6_LATCH